MKGIASKEVAISPMTPMQKQSQMTFRTAFKVETTETNFLLWKENDKLTRVYDQTQILQAMNRFQI